MPKEVKALDLLIQEETKRIVSLDKGTHNCYLRNSRAEKHFLHGEDFQLNNIIDLIIELGSTIDAENNRIFNILEIIAHSIGEKNKMISKIEEKLDYLQKDNHSLH